MLETGGALSEIWYGIRDLYYLLAGEVGNGG